MKYTQREKSLYRKRRVTFVTDMKNDDKSSKYVWLSGNN